MIPSMFVLILPTQWAVYMMPSNVWMLIQKSVTLQNQKMS